MKRILDVVFATIGLLLLLPVLAAVALMIKVDSRGPVLFRQVRVGRGSVEFSMYKFRTMRVDQRGSCLTIDGDSRITSVGRLLRTSKLDELPQLLNVIGGTMSLVGPRPEVPEYVALWPPDARNKILFVRPGMTDPAAIIFRHESALLASRDDPEDYYRKTLMPQKLELYKQYVASMTVIGDLFIIARTFATVLSPHDRVDPRDAR